MKPSSATTDAGLATSAAGVTDTVRRYLLAAVKREAGESDARHFLYLSVGLVI